MLDKIKNRFKKFNKKDFKVLIIFITLIFILAGGTFAWYSWNATDIGVDFVINSNIRIAVDGGVDITGKELYPTLDYTDTNYAITKTIKSWLLDPNDANNSTFNLKLNVMGISDNLKSSSFRWRIHKNGELKASGNFASVSTGASINLITNQIATTSKDIYTLYIYIDGSVDNAVTIANGTYNFRLVAEGANASLVEVDPEPNSPDLIQGLIPVSYNETTKTWVKADPDNNNNSWYDYSNKKWANAVLVTETNRSTYQSATAGTEITDSDILAFYVWIPRYKYKVWNKDKVVGTDSYNAQTTGIDIVFESDTNTTGTIICNNYSYSAPSSTAGSPNETCTGSNGDYYTHPAFTFGDNQVKGFWIGKYELSSETPTATDGGGKSTTLTPRILPNVISWRYNNVSNFSTVIQNMQVSNNIYGLSTDKSTTDSHMLTNMEWGAVAYLTNSNYGRCSNGSCTEVTINNCTTYTTGIGADTVSTSGTSTTCTTEANKYNGEKGVLASTTGNVYGVYDMSGGSWEYVMGNVSRTADAYTFSARGSNFAGSWYNDYSNQKYVNTYAIISSSDRATQKAYNAGRLGDATGEVVLSTGGSGGWYNDYANFPYSDYPWFRRGGTYGSVSSAGVLGFSYYNGSAGSDYSARAALVWFVS